MSPITKYAALRLHDRTTNDERFCDLHVGKVEWNYGRSTTPPITHDTKEEALAYAYEQNRYGTWLIQEVVEFDNY